MELKLLTLILVVMATVGITIFAKSKYDGDKKIDKNEWSGIFSKIRSSLAIIVLQVQSLKDASPQEVRDFTTKLLIEYIDGSDLLDVEKMLLKNNLDFLVDQTLVLLEKNKK